MEQFNSVRYDDDTTVITETRHKLQNMKQLKIETLKICIKMNLDKPRTDFICLYSFNRYTQQN